jgi:hypothetical protein
METKNVEITIKEPNKYPVSQLMSAVGFAGGVAYAFNKQTGFWRGWGIAIIGSVVLGGIGYGIDAMRNSK